MEITKDYCNRDIKPHSNLNEQQKQGMNDLLKRKRNKECVIFQTDKSGSMCVDSVVNYVNAAKPHVEKDPVISEDEYKWREKEFNAHATFWVNMLQIAKDSNQQVRFRSSMMSNNSGYAKQYIFRKDHKICIDEFFRTTCETSL